MWICAADFDDPPHGINSGAMPGRAIQSPLLRPAPVAIHNDGNMNRQLLGRNLLRQRREFRTELLAQTAITSFSLASATLSVSSIYLLVRS